MTRIALLLKAALSLVAAFSSASCTKEDKSSQPAKAEMVNPANETEPRSSQQDRGRAARQPPPVPTPANTKPLQPVTASNPDPTAARINTNDLGHKAWQQGMCAKCHRENGQGSRRAPNLTDSEWFHCDGSVEGIRKVLVTGVPKEELHDTTRVFQMNTVKNLVPDEKMITALAHYVYAMSHPDSD